MKSNISRVFSFGVVLMAFSALSLSGQDTSNVSPASKQVFIQSLDAFPSFNEITKWFFYQYKETSEGNQIRFAKDPRGWYVYEIKPTEPNYTINKQQIWSLDQLAYRKTNYRQVESQEAATRNYQKHIQPNQARLYRIHPFYGYNGWDRDVIHNMKDYKNLPDTLLYGLARAYSNFALSAVRHQYEYTKSEHRPAGYEKISKDRLKQFIESMNKALENYKELATKHPEFKTIVGPASTKYNNELIFTWHTLLSVKEPKLARKYLKKVDYNPFIPSMAKNYLNSADKNALLFTYGDNDTYPLWHLQKTKKYRTDVTVINLSLLNASWYVEMLKEELKEAGKTQLISFEKEDFERKQLGYALYLQDKAQDKFVSVDSVISFVRSDKSLVKVSKEQEVNHMPGNKFILEVSRDNVLKHYSLNDEEKLKIDDQIRWSLSRGYYMRNELLILDIMANNKWRYPIHYTVSGENRYFMGLDDYIQLNGLNYKLMPGKQLDKQHAPGNFAINAPASYSLLRNDFSFEGYSMVDSSHSFASAMTQNIRMTLGSVASALMTRNEKDSALELLDYVNEQIPINKFPYGFYNLAHAELYLQLKQTTKALDIIDNLAHKEMRRLKELKGKERIRSREINNSKHVLSQIIKLCQHYEYKARAKQYQDFLSSIN